MSNKGVKFRKSPEGITTFTIEMDEFLKKNYLKMPLKTMGKSIGKSDVGVRKRLSQLGLIIPPELIQKRVFDSRLKKGNIPSNKGKKWDEYLPKDIQERCRKGTFKKGQIPPNKLEVGAITTRSYGSRGGRKKYKVKFIKTGLGNLDWQPLHLFNWNAAGLDIPEGYVIAFKNGDVMNTELENLEIISMAENMKRNTIHNYPDDLKEILMLKGRIKRQINKHLKK